MIASKYKKLFSELNEANISWCSWKSNQHIDAALNGNTDLDLLFEPEQRYIVSQRMQDCGFVLFNAARHRSYPGVLDFISIDEVSGKILHVHAHFLLTLGEQNIKSFNFPFLITILQSRIKHQTIENLFISTPEVEIALLLIRFSLKTRYRDYIGQKLLRGNLNSDLLREFNWLKSKLRTNDSQFPNRLFLPPNLNEIISNVVKVGVSVDDLIRIKKEVISESLNYNWRRMPSLIVPILMWKNELINLIVRATDKLGFKSSPFIRRRTLISEGMVVAILGVDGAGKSTITSDIVACWANKIDIVPVYLGSGKNQSGWMSTALRLLAILKSKIFRNKNHKTNQPSRSLINPKNQEKKPTVFQLIQAIVNVLEKRASLKQIRRYRRQGRIIICDRWPQNQFLGINDGPKLSNFLKSKNIIVRTISNWEEKNFVNYETISGPDIVVKLHISAHCAFSRKKENLMQKSTIRKKINVVKSLVFSNETHVQDINAEQKNDVVRLEVMNALWGQVTSKRIYKPKYHECFGLPGSGKSTFCSNLEINNVLPFKLSREKCGSLYFYQVFSGLLYDSKLILYLLVFFVLHPQFWNRNTFGRFVRLPVQKQKIRAVQSSNIYHLSEQFLLQNLWSAMMDAKNVANINENVLTLLVTELYSGMCVRLLFFDVDLETSKHRILRRTKSLSRFDKFVATDNRDDLEKGVTVISQISKSVQNSGVDFVKIDANNKKNDMYLFAKEAIFK